MKPKKWYIFTEFTEYHRSLHRYFCLLSIVSICGLHLDALKVRYSNIKYLKGKIFDLNFKYAEKINRALGDVEEMDLKRKDTKWFVWMKRYI